MAAISQQRWNPDHYADHAGFVAALGEPLMTLLNPQPGQHILDLGCGDGVLTAKLAETGCTIVAVDSSPEMIQAARQRGLDARVMAGEALTFETEFDGVFSNAALHWMLDAERVVDGVFRALKPGGCFVAEMGADGNVAMITQALEQVSRTRGDSIRHPWYFPTAAAYQSLLEQAGFTIRTISQFARPTPLKGTVSGWLTTFAQHFTQGMSESETVEFIDEVTANLQPKLMNQQGIWQADYVRLRFVAQKN